VQRRTGASAAILFDKGAQMDQIRLEDLQPPPQFLDLVVKFAFYFGSFAGLIADMNIHKVPQDWEEIPRQIVRRPPLYENCTPANETRSPRCMLCWKIFSKYQKCLHCPPICAERNWRALILTRERPGSPGWSSRARFCPSCIGSIPSGA